MVKKISAALREEWNYYRGVRWQRKLFRQFLRQFEFWLDYDLMDIVD